MDNRFKLTCLNCGKSFMVDKNRSIKQRLNTKYCSRKCWKLKHIISDFKKYIKNNSIKDKNGCWLWLKSYDNTGYGVASFKRKKINAHRLSYKTFKEKIPKGMIVCHKCDVKACVNPDHLFLGTQLDNMRDKIRKGRHPNGCNHSNSKLSISDIQEIRYNKKKYSHKKLAIIFDVSKSTITRIINHKTYKETVIGA